MPRLLIKEIVSVGAVDAGDDPESHIMFFKRRDKVEYALEVKRHKDPKAVADDIRVELNKISKESRPTADDSKKEVRMDRPDLSQLGEKERAPFEAYFAELDEQQKAQEAELVKAKADLEAAKPPEEDPTEELLKAAPKEVQDLLKKQADELAAVSKAREDDRKELDAEIAKTRKRDFSDEAAKFPAVFLKASDAGSRLAAIEAGVDAETYAWLTERFSAAEAVMDAENILKEVGRTEGGDKVESLVKAKQEADPKLTVEQARSQVWTENPDLVEEVRS